MWPNTVRKTDLRIEFCRGSGAGGQNRNKRDTACRIVHIPTGIAATAEDQRTQSSNRVLAFKRLVKKLIPLMHAAATPEKEDPSQERVRTYNEARNEVIDHRLTGVKFNYDTVLNGDIGPIIKRL